MGGTNWTQWVIKTKRGHEVEGGWIWVELGGEMGGECYKNTLHALMKFSKKKIKKRKKR